MFKVPKLVKPNDAILEYDMNPYVEDLRLEDDDFAQLPDDELEDMFINWRGNIDIIMKFCRYQIL